MKMIKVKTAELVGAQLDYAVAVADGRAGSDDDEEAVPGKMYWCSTSSPAEGLRPAQHMGPSQINPETGWHFGRYSPSTDWALAGPIIDREKIQLDPPSSPVHRSGGPPSGWGESGIWGACTWQKGVTGKRAFAFDPSSPLTAAMRCFVKLKLGDEVEVPALEGGQ
jgi:hypothetical protein